MKPYSLDEHWELLMSEYIGRDVPWIDRKFYVIALWWLTRRIKHAAEWRRKAGIA